MITDPTLILVDMQNDFCKRGYGFNDEDADVSALKEATAAAGEFLREYRSSGRTPILVRTIHDDEVDSDVWKRQYADQSRPRPCERGTPGVDFVSELDARDTDVVVTKHRYDSFLNTDLDTYLSANDVSEVLIGGVLTNVCVESAARSAFDRDYDVTVLEDCVGALGPEAHDRGLARIDSFFGSVERSGRIELPDVDEGVPAGVSTRD